MERDDTFFTGHTLWLRANQSLLGTEEGSALRVSARRDRASYVAQVSNLPYRRLPSRHGVEFYGGPDIDSDSQVSKPAIQQVWKPALRLLHSESRGPPDGLCPSRCPHPGPLPSDRRGRGFANPVVNPAVSSLDKHGCRWL